MAGPDDVKRKLGRFTPVGPALDRDDLLFAAGRASVRSPRRWKWAAGLLAVSQAATLGLLVVTWRSAGTSAGVPTPPARYEPETPPEPPSDSYLVLTRASDYDPDRLPAPTGAALPPASRPYSLWSARAGELP